MYIKVACRDHISIANPVHSHTWITDAHPICEGLLVRIPTRIDELDLYNILSLNSPGGFEVSIFDSYGMWVIKGCYIVATEGDFHFGSAEFFMTVRFSYSLEGKRYWETGVYQRLSESHVERLSVNWSRFGF